MRCSIDALVQTAARFEHSISGSVVKHSTTVLPLLAYKYVTAIFAQSKRFLLLMRQIDTKFSQNWKFEFKKSFVFYHQHLLKVWRKIEYFFPFCMNKSKKLTCTYLMKFLHWAKFSRIFGLFQYYTLFYGILQTSNKFNEISSHLTKYQIIKLIQWGSVTHQTVTVPSISCCFLNHHNLFYQIQNALAFNGDMCCHLALCLQLLLFHFIIFLYLSLSLLMILKVYWKISVLLGLFQILEILDLAMTKDEEVNVTVTSSKHHSNPFLGKAQEFFFHSSPNQVSLCVESILFVRQSLLQGNWFQEYFFYKIQFRWKFSTDFSQ